VLLLVVLFALYVVWALFAAGLAKQFLSIEVSATGWGVTVVAAVAIGVLAAYGVTISDRLVNATVGYAVIFGTPILVALVAFGIFHIR
jgi:hypothetical protein